MFAASRTLGHRMDLTDQQCALIEPLFETKRRADGRGRPWRDKRDVLNGVPWVLRTGAPWKDLPTATPPYQTCRRRVQQWQRTGVLRDLLECLAEDLRLRGKLDLTEGFIDATFAEAKKGVMKSVRRDGAKAARPWRSATAMVVLSPSTWPALRPRKSASWTPRSTTTSSQRSRNG